MFCVLCSTRSDTKWKYPIRFSFYILVHYRQFFYSSLLALLLLNEWNYRTFPVPPCSIFKRSTIFYEAQMTSNYSVFSWFSHLCFTGGNLSSKHFLKKKESRKQSGEETIRRSSSIPTLISDPCSNLQFPHFDHKFLFGSLKCNSFWLYSLFYSTIPRLGLRPYKTLWRWLAERLLL